MNQPTVKKQTKIVATISDLHCEEEFIRELYDNGMNVVRLNTAHQTHEDSLKIIKSVRNVSEKIPLLLDTKGPEIRTTKGDEPIQLKKGNIVQVKGSPNRTSTSEKLYFSYDNIVNDVPIDSTILIDDGDIALKVKDKREDKLFCEVLNDGTIDGRKSVNIPGTHISLPSLTDKDRDYVMFAIENEIDFIAHSFVRNKQDLLDIQEILDKHNSSIKLIAKIENQEGVDNIDEILDHCEGIMVARGDLGIEIPAVKIPQIQKSLIKKAIAKRKIVITATQMLHTMIKNPRPTRAEVSDVANAIMDGTDAVMLSGETAYGKYPLEAVKTMASIAQEVETQLSGYKKAAIPEIFNTSTYLIKAAVRATLHLPIEAIVIDTIKGSTARNISSFRPKVPVYAMCFNKKVMRELGLRYGIYGHFYGEHVDNTDKFIKETLEHLTKEDSLLNKESQIVFLGGNFGSTEQPTFVEITSPKAVLE
ncbi:pyruvate kinase [Candidatus Woesearchaeota archaeon]|nr:pyruvate kinase [Candidatus Woesearchaeota archaeon]